MRLPLGPPGAAGPEPQPRDQMGSRAVDGAAGIAEGPQASGRQEHRSEDEEGKGTLWDLKYSKKNCEEKCCGLCFGLDLMHLLGLLDPHGSTGSTGST